MTFVTKIWSRIVPVLRLWILLAFSTLATLPMLGFDGHYRANIAYDGSRVSEMDYDTGLILSTGERKIETIEGSVLFSNFVVFLAAEGGTAEKLVTWVDEGGNLRAGSNPGMRPNAYDFQSRVSGARSSVLTGRSQAPYLSFKDEAGNVVGAEFDGVQGSELIDRKLNPFFSAKAVNEATRQAAVAQHYGLQAVWELPTPTAVNAANRFMQNNNINGIIVRLAQ